MIRGIWDDVDAHRRARRRRALPVRGAKRGPEPAHDMEIWLGAYKPRMLRLTGAKADGWLPSLAYLKPEDIAPSNRAIDEAALAAGRDPREIRRLLNLSGPTRRSRSSCRSRSSTASARSSSAGDDPREISASARDRARAARGGRERARRWADSAPVRGANALAMRREGIDYDAAPVDAVEPGDKAYGKVRSTYIRTGSPGLVLRPESADEVADALAYAREQDVPLAVRSGGHGISGRSTNDGGIVIDVGKLNAIEVDGPARPARARRALGPRGTGARPARARDELGRLRRRRRRRPRDRGRHRLPGAQARPDDRPRGRRRDRARRRERSCARDDDLLWAIRGAGGNFGIVTEFELEAYDVGNVVFSTMAFDASATADLLERWGEVIEASPRELTSFLNLPRPGAALLGLRRRRHGGGRRRADAAARDRPAARPAGATRAVSGDRPAARRRPLRRQHRGVPLRAARPHHARGGAEPRRARRADPPDPLRSAARSTTSIRRPRRTRTARRTSRSAPSGARLNARWDADVYPHMNGLYISFDSDLRPERLHDAFPGETLERLRALKAHLRPRQRLQPELPDRARHLPVLRA